MVYQTIRYHRNAETTKAMQDEKCHTIVVTNQGGSYNSLDHTRHQFCLAHVTRNLQQMSEYIGGGLTSHMGKRLDLLCHAVFRIQHRYEQGKIIDIDWRRRIFHLKKNLSA
ncbi:hypothetical protein [Candidatus Enterovibrio escicola]